MAPSGCCLPCSAQPNPTHQWWHGNLSYKDFLADLAGIALAAAAILAYHTYRQTAGSAAAAATSSALAGLASALQRQPGYRPVPNDIEMGAAPSQQ